MNTFSKSLAAATLAIGLMPSIAAASEFTLFVYETPQDLALRADKGVNGQTYWAEYARFADVLKAAGAIRGGAPLQLPAEAVTFDGKRSRTGTVEAGPLQLGGYFKVEAVDIKAAEALAAAAPAARRGGAVVVRETYPNPMMAN